MRKERKNFKIIFILMFVLFLVLFVSCDPGDDPADPNVVTIDVINWIGGPDIYLAYVYDGQYTSPKIAQFYSWFCLDDLGIPLEHSFSDELVLFDNFTLKFYSSEVTNATNWDAWNQKELNMDALEGLVYYATNISNGLSRPELFDIGNDLPFYLSTNSASLKINVKELQTNR